MAGVPMIAGRLLLADPGAIRACRCGRPSWPTMFGRRRNGVIRRALLKSGAWPGAFFWRCSACGALDVLCGCEHRSVAVRAAYSFGDWPPAAVDR